LLPYSHSIPIPPAKLLICTIIAISFAFSQWFSFLTGSANTLTRIDQASLGAIFIHKFAKSGFLPLFLRNYVILRIKIIKHFIEFLNGEVYNK